MRPLPCLPVRALLCALGAWAGGVRAETVAWWRFDEAAGGGAGTVLRDAGPHGYALVLGRGAGLAPGRTGNALRPGTAGATWFSGDAARAGRTPAANASDSKLNLGAGDWTVDGWLRVDATAHDEGVIFEIGTGPAGANDLLTRISALPRENAFALTSVAASGATPGVGARRIEFPRADGPPAGPAHVEVATLAVDAAPLPREGWFHFALVHAGVAGELRLYLDGRLCAVAAARIEALPHGDAAYVSVGCDGRGGRRLAGAIDELRLSDHAADPAEATPSRP